MGTFLGRKWWNTEDSNLNLCSITRRMLSVQTTTHYHYASVPLCLPAACFWKAWIGFVAGACASRATLSLEAPLRTHPAVLVSGVGFTLLHPAEGLSLDRHRYPAGVCTIFNNIYFDYGILGITPIFSPSFRLWSARLRISLLRIYHSACFSVLAHPEGMRCDTETFLHRHSGHKPLCKIP